jgi:hypothetical protein
MASSSSTASTDNNISIVEIVRDSEPFWELETEFEGFLNNVHSFILSMHASSLFDDEIAHWFDADR